jgi:hypothetical protein
MKTIEVWGVAVMATKQQAAAKAHCFGDCGKISMAGAINDERMGGLFVCLESSCAYEAMTIRDYGSTMSFGKPHTVHLRMLKPETENVTPNA